MRDAYFDGFVVGSERKGYGREGKTFVALTLNVKFNEGSKYEKELPIEIVSFEPDKADELERIREGSHITIKALVHAREGNNDRVYTSFAFTKLLNVIPPGNHPGEISPRQPAPDSDAPF